MLQPPPPPQANIPLINQFIKDNPLHISIFPPYVPLPLPTTTTSSSTSTSSTSTRQGPTVPPSQGPPTPSASTLLEFSFLLNASLDAFAARTRDRTRLDQDLGLLLRVDERRAVWGWETGTGVKFVVVTEGWWGDGGGGAGGGGLKVVSFFFFFFQFLFDLLFVVFTSSSTPKG